MKDIKPQDLEVYQGKRQRQGRAKSTIDKELVEAQAMVNKAADNDMISPQVQRVFTKWKRLLPNKDANRRTRFLTEEEFWLFWEHLPKHLKPVVLCAIYTGMRRSEILDLTWDRVDLDRRLIYLEAKHTKEKAPKTEYISDALLEVLEDLPRYADQNHVFLYAGRPIKGEIRNGIRAACAKAKIPYGMKTPGGVVFHDLRRSFRVLMRKAGIDRDVIRTFTGHHSEEMDSRYNVVEDRDRQEAVEALETVLGTGRSKSRSKTLH